LKKLEPEEIIDAKLGALIEEIGKKTFVKDYNPSQEEVLGIIVSKISKWNGVDIAKVAYNAFEDANFHTFNNEFATLCKKHGMEVE